MPQALRRTPINGPAARAAKKSAAPSREHPPAKPMPKGFTMPKTLAGCADKLYTVQLERFTLNHQVEDKKTIESALSDRLIAELPVGEANGIIGQQAQAEITQSEVFYVTDWDKLYKHIKATGQFALLNKALNAGTCAEMFGGKSKLSPAKYGIARMPKKKVSITKRKNRGQ